MTTYTEWIEVGEEIACFGIELTITRDPQAHDGLISNQAVAAFFPNDHFWVLGIAGEPDSWIVMSDIEALHLRDGFGMSFLVETILRRFADLRTLLAYA